MVDQAFVLVSYLSNSLMTKNIHDFHNFSKLERGFYGEFLVNYMHDQVPLGNHFLAFPVIRKKLRCIRKVLESFLV